MITEYYSVINYTTRVSNNKTIPWYTTILRSIPQFGKDMIDIMLCSRLEVVKQAKFNIIILQSC